MEIIELPKTPFSINKLQFLEDNGQLKDNLDVFNYVMDYYYETKNGMFFFYDAISDEFEYKDEKDFKKEVIYKLKNEKLYKRFEMNSKIFKMVSIIGKPRIYKEGEERYYINQSGYFLHQSYKHYDEYSTEIKEKVEMIFDMMKVVSCSNDEKLFKRLKSKKLSLLYFVQNNKQLRNQFLNFLFFCTNKK
jgi:hypothetical protein